MSAATLTGEAGSVVGQHAPSPLTVDAETLANLAVGWLQGSGMLPETFGAEDFLFCWDLVPGEGGDEPRLTLVRRPQEGRA